MNFSAIAKSIPEQREEIRYEISRPSKDSKPVQQEKPVKPVPVPQSDQFPSLGATSKKFGLTFMPKETSQNSVWKESKPSLQQDQSLSSKSTAAKASPPPGFQLPASSKPPPPPGESSAFFFPSKWPDWASF